jgi:hypothetical protein
VASAVLAGDTADVPLEEEADFTEVDGVEIRSLDEEEPARIGVWLGERLLGRFPNRYRQDAMALLSTGLAVHARTIRVDGGAVISIGLAEEPED